MIGPPASPVTKAAGAAIAGIAALAVGALVVGCVIGRAFVGTRPDALAGVWVDSARATPTDTVAWILSPGGTDETLHITVVRRPAGDSTVTPPTIVRETTRYGAWYVAGDPDDTTARQLCVRRKGRAARSACFRFHLDTLPASDLGGARRRLVVFGYQGHHRSGDRVLFERLP